MIGYRNEICENRICKFREEKMANTSCTGGVGGPVQPVQGKSNSLKKPPIGRFTSYFDELEKPFLSKYFFSSKKNMETSF